MVFDEENLFILVLIQGLPCDNVDTIPDGLSALGT